MKAEGVIQLVERYKRFAAERAKEAEERAERIKVRRDDFWKLLQEARAAHTERERIEAPRFNLLRLLDREKLEDTHSRFLADLLDPHGTHGQKTLFLERFLDLVGLGHLKLQLDAPCGYVTISRNHPITGGKPDIVLQCGSLLLLVIENKVKDNEHRQPDGRWQLEVYRQWLERQAADERHLFFLTIHGDRSESGVEDRDLSYLRDVRSWLEDSVDCVGSPTIQHTLRRYLDTIEVLRDLKREEEANAER